MLFFNVKTNFFPSTSRPESRFTPVGFEFINPLTEPFAGPVRSKIELSVIGIQDLMTAFSHFKLKETGNSLVCLLLLGFSFARVALVYILFFNYYYPLTTKENTCPIKTRSKTYTLIKKKKEK